MKDLNFFEPYIEKKEFKLSKTMVLYSLLSLICMVLVLYAGLNQIKLMKLNSQVNQLQVQAENPEMLDKVAYIQEKEEEMNSFRIEVENIRYMDKVLESKEIGSDDLIRKITYSLPKDTYLTSITLFGDSISIHGLANDKWSIAEFGRALDIMEGLDEVYISSISTLEDRFSFNLDISLEGEDADGEDEIDEAEENQDQISN